MRKLRDWIQSDYICITCILVVIVSMPLIWIPSYQWLSEMPDIWAETIRYTGTALISIALMYAVWGRWTFPLWSTHFLRNLFTFGLLGLIGAAGALVFSYEAVDMTPSFSILLGYICMNVAIAVSEEFLFRGVILNGLLQAWKHRQHVMSDAVIVCCILFGLRHLLNLITKPQALFGTLAQVVFTFMAGMYLCAVYLRTENLWICILIHFLEDFSTSVWQMYSSSAAASANADVTVSGACMMILIQIPYVIFAILMLNDKKWDRMPKQLANS